MPTESPLGCDGHLLQRRKQVLGAAYRHFYDQPLHPVRGHDVWLVDADGRSYLDCYNNVPCVGHSHPRVVAALAAQAATLNTHTRYLQDGVVAYAERLAALFDPALDTVMLTCTGSEANDLALRIAFDVTGRCGLVVTDNAYHGVTMALADMSPSLQPVAGHVRTVRPPDSYRAEPGTDIAARFAADVQRAVDELRLAGRSPAALIVDTVFASDGVHPDTHGALLAGAQVMRAAGGLFIADEVQGGFGRTGRHWWAFQREPALLPDMVTLGKPMGAGHPLAGIVLQSALATTFGSRCRYFNTFGGNTVSAAVGMAVLDVLVDEDLLARADTVGQHLKAGMQALARQHPAIGDVRGAGLYLGVELVDDPATKLPASALARRLINRLRDDGVLVGTCGREAHVLKIRPPQTFQRAHADRLLEALDTGLRAVGLPG